MSILKSPYSFASFAASINGKTNENVYKGKRYFFFPDETFLDEKPDSSL